MPVAAWYVSNILLGSPPPENGAPGRIAFKTGTSYGYRDAWSVGFDGRHTIGVWVGRPDGAPVPGLIGREAAAPILFDAFARLGAPVALPRPPRGVLMTSNAKLPPPLRRFQAEPHLPAAMHKPRCTSCSRPTARCSICRPPTANPIRFRSNSAARCPADRPGQRQPGAGAGTGNAVLHA